MSLGHEIIRQCRGFFNAHYLTRTAEGAGLATGAILLATFAVNRLRTSGAIDILKEATEEYLEASMKILHGPKTRRLATGVKDHIKRRFEH